MLRSVQKQHLNVHMYLLYFWNNVVRLITKLFFREIFFFKAALILFFLLNFFLAEETTNNESDENSTAENEDVSRPGPQTCVPDDEITPATLCKSTYNTTAPMYGVSLTSGEPVTIVQIFPDLLQQVVFEKCE